MYRYSVSKNCVSFINLLLITFLWITSDESVGGFQDYDHDHDLDNIHHNYDYRGGISYSVHLFYSVLWMITREVILLRI